MAVFYIPSAAFWVCRLSVCPLPLNPTPKSPSSYFPNHIHACPALFPCSLANIGIAHHTRRPHTQLHDPTTLLPGIRFSFCLLLFVLIPSPIRLNTPRPSAVLSPVPQIFCVHVPPKIPHFASLRPQVCPKTPYMSPIVPIFLYLASNQAF